MRRKLSRNQSEVSKIWKSFDKRGKYYLTCFLKNTAHFYLALICQKKKFFINFQYIAHCDIMWDQSEELY